MHLSGSAGGENLKVFWRACLNHTGIGRIGAKVMPVFLLFFLSPNMSCRVLAKDPVEAAQDLALANQSDPGGFTLMIVSISMLFVCALSLIIAASMHLFKRKQQPLSQAAARAESAAADNASSEE